MAHQLNCPCGQMIAALDDEFLATVHDHLHTAHPGREYADHEIMMLALPLPDRVILEARGRSDTDGLPS